ncbi:helix-turn-helix domain-containing protein [Aliivibrio finisterrensis]|uniref:helix-turn-helix domain-containing protein n=1 Tax=Aliivibrio finisterrensis TaxID=511998 RepID=UPI001F5CA4E2|nr:helix-turn-helix transcriptional regulator [Aliivibrio finisterrensis]
MDKLSSEICEVIKKELKKAGFSYKELSINIGVSEVSIKRMLNGHQSLSILRVSEIAGVIQVSLSYIISEAEKNIASVPLFTKEQDIAFTKSPELYTLL